MKIGKVISIEHDKFKIKLSSEIITNSLHISGETYYFGNIGGYVKIKNSLNEWIICEIISIFNNDNNSDDQYSALPNRDIIAKPIGSLSSKNDNFKLGISIFPSIYSNVEIITHENMNHILSNDNEQDSAGQVHSHINIGTSKNLINYPVKISIDKLFNIHSAILGNSGSGKSNTISTILQAIIEKKNFSAECAKIVIFDVNGEYENAIENKKENGIKIKYFKPNIDKKDIKEIKKTNPKKNIPKPFYLPHFLLDLDEWADFLLATEAPQKLFFKQVRQESIILKKISNNKKKLGNYIKCRITSLVEETLKVADNDTSVITTSRNLLYKIESIIKNDKINKTAGIEKFIKEFIGKCNLEYGQNKELKKHIDGISNDENINRDKYNTLRNKKIKANSYFDYKFIQTAAEWTLLEEEAKGNKRIREHTSTMISRLEHFTQDDECKFMRDGNKIKSKKGFYDQLFEDNQIVIIDTSELNPYSLETLTSVTSRILFDYKKEANNRNKEPIHLILDEAHRYIKKDTKYIIKENIFEKISREGRKFAIYLMVSSQRPSELSETVLSQCGNFIIHRIQSQIDMNFIANIMPFFSDDFRNKIKLSVPGEALMFGNFVPMPLQVKIKKANPEPKSKNCNIPEEWFKKR
ncbi:MAG: DUF87 domain-containing protein [Alphaproteobacteria bacterium]|nr:DUF87 domain-containing protein [Alphaproteobacteria bacterium]